MKLKFLPDIVAPLAIVAIVTALVLVLGGHWPMQKKAAPVAVVALPGVTVQQVPAKEITAATATTIVKDPADQKLIKDLLAENAKYKLQVTGLVVSRGESTSTGTLTPAVVAPTQQTAAVDTPRPFELQDYRLHVVGDTEKVTYTLTQQFLVLATSGRDKTGARIADVKLFEVGPGDKRTPIAVNTSEVIVDDTVPHWLTGFNVQGGVAAVTGHATGYVAGLQWLVRGRANTPRDLKWAALTPVAFFSPDTHEVGLLPVSANVANFVPHLPLTNLWASPLVTFGPDRSIKRVGVALSVTF